MIASLAVAAFAVLALAIPNAGARKGKKPDPSPPFRQGTISDGDAELNPVDLPPLNVAEYALPNENVDIGAMVDHLRNGGKAHRSGWNGSGMWIKMQVPDAQSKMTHPYLYIEYPEGHPAYDHEQYPTGARVPWLASQTDILATDWQLG